MVEVELQPHNPTWHDHFEQERDRIRKVANDGLLGIFHIGSTAIPGLLAKPKIDILSVYAKPSAIHNAKDTLLNEYNSHRDDEDWVVLTRTEEEHSIVLHLRPQCVQKWRDQLVFREFLRDNPCARAEYEGAKRTAAAEYPNNVDAYTDAKEPVIRLLTERGYEEGYHDQLPEFANKD